MNKNSLFFAIALISVSVVFAWAGGDGSPGNPWLIDLCSDINDIAVNGTQNLTHSYRLTQNLECGGGVYYVDDPVRFSGTIDGAGFYISNISAPRNSSSSGFIRGTDGATIKDLGIINSYFSGSFRVGALIGDAAAGANNITNCYSMNNVINNSNGDGTGGLVGSMGREGSVMTDTYSKDNTILCRDDCGGLVGDFAFTIMSRGYSIGNTISCRGKCGGVLGERYLGSFSEVFSRDNYVGGTSWYVGGVIGNGAVSQAYSVNNTVNGDHSRLGGVVGSGSASFTYSACNVIADVIPPFNVGEGVIGLGSSPQSYSDITNTCNGVACSGSVDVYMLDLNVSWSNTTWDYLNPKSYPTLLNIDFEQQPVCGKISQEGIIPEVSNKTLQIFVIMIVALLIGAFLLKKD